MANEAKHTPGPWKVEPYPLNVCAPGASPRGNDLAICTCDGPADETGIANARLIAASPDLLAACEFDLVELRAKFPDVSESCFNGFAVVKVLRAAIAKATK
jgi:hypothetical protein